MKKDFREIWASLKKNSDGLIPCIAQDKDTLEVLMLAYMDEESFCRTLETGYAHYHSRSRNILWKKGETSGNVQRIAEVRVDCDLDTILLMVFQSGPACHTGAKSCFYRDAVDI